MSTKHCPNSTTAVQVENTISLLVQLVLLKVCFDYNGIATKKVYSFFEISDTKKCSWLPNMARFISNRNLEPICERISIADLLQIGKRCSTDRNV